MQQQKNSGFLLKGTRPLHGFKKKIDNDVAVKGSLSVPGNRPAFWGEQLGRGEQINLSSITWKCDGWKEGLHGADK